MFWSCYSCYTTGNTFNLCTRSTDNAGHGLIIKYCQVKMKGLFDCFQKLKYFRRRHNYSSRVYDREGMKILELSVNDL